jgi:hypothetical protein
MRGLAPQDGCAGKYGESATIARLKGATVSDPGRDACAFADLLRRPCTRYERI